MTGVPTCEEPTCTSFSPSCCRRRRAATPPATPNLAVSLERIRRELEKPPETVVIAVAPGVPPIFRMKVEEQRLDVERLWREDLPVPTFVRPVRGLTHHEFLGAVTPELFRGTAQHPCCNVLPAIEAIGPAIARANHRRAEARARREVRKALEEFKKTAASRDR